MLKAFLFVNRRSNFVNVRLAVSSHSQYRARMSEETILQMVEPGTPPGYKDAIIEIRSPNGTKRITNDRLAEITTQSRRLSRGRKALGTMLFDSLIEQEVRK